MPENSWKLAPGLHHVGAYQVSAKPFCSGNIECKVHVGPMQVSFPGVTSWLYVINRAGDDCKVGYSKNGVLNTNYFVVPASSSNGGPSYSPLMPVKVSEIWISGSAVVDVVAGITYISATQTKTNLGTSWSGSTGVG